MKGNKIKIILLILTIVLAGFGRDFVMKNINWVIKYLTQGGTNFSQSVFNPFLNWEVSDLIRLKWGLTIGFTLLFYILTKIIIQSIFKRGNTLVKLFYFTLIASATFIYFIGYVFGIIDTIYPTVRTIMGITQSFVPFIIIYLFLKFYSSINLTKKNE